MGTGTAAVARGPLARWSSLRIDPATATLRPFLAAYLVVLGLSITMLPVVRVTGVTDEWPRGLLTAATGLVVMWLGLLPPRRSTTLLHLVGLPQVVVGIVMMLGGLLVAGFMLALVGSAVVLLPVLDGRPVNRTAARGDVLTYLLLIVLAFQGVAIASGLDGASRLVERADLSPLAVGTVLAVLGLGGIAAWWVGATAIGSLATIGGGLALFVLAAISAAGLGPALWILSGATYLRIGAMLLTPWRTRWSVDWRSLEAVLALALVTAGVLPILIVVAVEHLSGAIQESTLSERQVRFAAAAFALLVVAIAGIVGGRLLARPITHLRARVAALPLGPSEPAPEGVEVSEIAEIGRALDEASAALVRERRHKDELIATLQERNRDLAEATAAKDEFLGMVSHELKTPITAILGYSELLARPGLAGTGDLIEDIRDEANRLGSIVDNLLALARLDAGRPTDPEPVVLQSLVADAVRRTAERAPDRGLRAEVPRSMIVEVTIDQLRLVIHNLLSNAIKYGDPAGEILIRAAEVEQRAILTVTDGGPGVPDDQREAVFEPFFRSPTTASTVAGMGIGLAVCRRIVEANGGRCWAEPTTDGGTAFKVSLPLAI
jgi:signal transduction histidine kinase